MPLIIFIRDSQYGMPIAQSVHLVGLTVLLATVLVLNLRLADVALKDSSLNWLAGQLRPWMLGGLAVGRVADRADARRNATVDATAGPPPTGPDPTDDVAIIGDSITEQAEPLLLAELQPDSVVRVRGRGGYRIEQMEPYAVEAAAAEPEQVIINLGSNDVLLSWPLERSVEAYTRAPLPADDPHTFFNLVYHLHQATSYDSAPTVSLVHKGAPAFASSRIFKSASIVTSATR